MPIDGATIAKRVAKGYAISGRIVGVPHELYRPSSVNDALALLNREGEIRAAFDARPSYKFQIPALHGDAARYALVDPAAVQPGDYLVGPSETVFVAVMPHLQPILCFACNAVVSLRRLDPPAGFGVVPERSDAFTNETVLWSGWPCSALFAGRGRSGADDLPGDMPSPEYTVLLPAIPGGEPPRPGDVLTDEQGRRYAVAWWEATPPGWRVVARLLTAG